MILIQYIPSFAWGKSPLISRVNSLEHLTCLPWIKKWTEAPKFFRLSLSGAKLMAEIDEGKEWYIVGTFYDEVNTVKLGLSEWTTYEQNKEQGEK